MKNNVPGHQYEMSNFENKDQQGQILQFIHKEPKEEGSTGLVTPFFVNHALGNM
jgi:hypothetical protein